MNTTLSISIERVLESVYAHSAAEIVATGPARPELLSRSHADMLKVITRDTIAGVAFALTPMLTDSNIAAKPMPDIITLEMNLPEGVSQTMLQAAIETAVAAGTLARAWSGSDSPMCQRYSEAYKISIESIARISCFKGLPGAIKPTA